MSDDPDLAKLQLAGERFVASLAEVGDQHLALPTPCDDWDLQALVDHVVGGNWFTCLILNGLSADDAMAQTMARFGSGSATVEQARASAAEQQAAFEQSDVFEQVWRHVAGDLSGRQIIRLRLHDLIVHTWDIDTSLGADATVPGELVQWALDELGRPDSLTSSFFAPTGRSDATPAVGDEAIYLRLLGRTSS